MVEIGGTSPQFGVGQGHAYYVSIHPLRQGNTFNVKGL
jgi:hypothetical protein